MRPKLIVAELAVYTGTTHLPVNTRLLYVYPEAGAQEGDAWINTHLPLGLRMLWPTAVWSQSIEQHVLLERALNTGWGRCTLYWSDGTTTTKVRDQTDIFISDTLVPWLITHTEAGHPQRYVAVVPGAEAAGPSASLSVRTSVGARLYNRLGDSTPAADIEACGTIMDGYATTDPHWDWWFGHGRVAYADNFEGAKLLGFAAPDNDTLCSLCPRELLHMHGGCRIGGSWCRVTLPALPEYANHEALLASIEELDGDYNEDAQWWDSHCKDVEPTSGRTSEDAVVVGTDQQGYGD